MVFFKKNLASMYWICMQLGITVRTRTIPILRSRDVNSCQNNINILDFEFEESI